MIPRYTRQDMGHVWSDANKFAKWLEVELAATETLAEAGQVPKEAAAAIRARAKIDVAQIHKIEARVKHDVIALSLGSSLPRSFDSLEWPRHTFILPSFLVLTS